MSNIATFLFVFVGILVVGGWISSEMISRRASKSNKKTTLRAAKLEKENNMLLGELKGLQEKYGRLKEEYDIAKVAKQQLREFEKEYKRIHSVNKKIGNGIVSLRELVGHKKYHSNSLSREVILHLDAHCPSESQMQQMRDDSTREVFKRIKNKMHIDQ